MTVLDAPFPAIDPNALGTLKSVNIDALLLPYVLGALSYLANPIMWSGDQEDIIGTLYAVQELLRSVINPGEGAVSGWTEGAGIWRNADQNVNGSGRTILGFNTSLHNVGGLYDPIGAPGRITVQTTGIYSIAGHVVLDGIDGTFHKLVILLNGTVVLAENYLARSADDYSGGSAAIWRCDAGNYIQLAVEADGGVLFPCLSLAYASPRLAVQRIG